MKEVSETLSKNGTEDCQRCGDVGYDRRTLWMSCFYDMNELKLPFKEVSLMVVSEKDVQSKEVQVPYKSTVSRNGEKWTEEGTYPCTVHSVSGEARVNPKGFFTFRVCKGCRADWMSAIKNWFLTKPVEQQSCGSGIFVRENGRNVEITEEEWRRRRST